jgi:hypothetical protein
VNRRRAAAVALALVVLTAVLGGAARAEPATAMRYPPGASGTWFSGKAFDACDAPSRTALQAWLSSPYRALGVYISGPLRACGQARLTASWVTDVTKLGWKILPLDVGLQAPCRAATRLRAMSRTPAKAAAQGATAARGALAAARSLGILPGSAIYSDLEPYYASRDAGCAAAVRSYVGGWTKTLHGAGYLAGVYASHSYGATSLGDSYGSEKYARPDAIWSARWDRVDRLRGWPGISDQKWSVHQRVKQYRGDHDEVHGGIRLNIDSNVVDGPVATVALPYEVTLGSGLVKRDRPNLDGADKGSVAQGSTVRVVCQVSTALGRWDKLVDGTYLPDAVVAGGADKPQLPGCATPYQVAGGVTKRAGPGVGHPARGVTYDGALAWITCESPGIILGRQGYWQRLQGGLWVSGALIAIADPTKRSPAVPLCAI